MANDIFLGVDGLDGLKIGSSQVDKVYQGSNQVWINDIVGQQLFTSSGTFVVPAGVTSVCAVAIGGGGGGMYYNVATSVKYPMNGGTGGGLGWRNNMTVVAGNSYTVTVGAGGNSGAYSSGSTSGGTSSFYNGIISVQGFGGTAGRYDTSAAGGFYTGDGGGNGGAVTNTSGNSYGPCAGSGAGGYSGDGGGTTNITGSAGAGGGGGGGNSGTGLYSGGGGGVGVLGEGTSGAANGGGGSGGANGIYSANGHGGLYGAGGGGCSTVSQGTAGNGGAGAVRIIWGTGRAFPSTLTGDL